MSVESFSFRNCIRYSPVKIVPEGGAHIDVSYLPNNFQRTTPVIDKAPGADDADGVITLCIGNKINKEKTTVRNGEVTVPDGATVSCVVSDMEKPIQIEVHRNGSRPMVFDPNTDEHHMHHIDGESPFTGQEFPHPLEPKMKVWEEKSPTYLNQKQLQEILGFTVGSLVEKGFLYPRQEQYSTAKYFTQSDILRAFLVRTVKKEHHLFSLRQISSSSISPITEKIVAYLREQKDWKELVKRAKTFGVDLEKTATELTETRQKNIHDHA